MRGGDVPDPQCVLHKVAGFIIRTFTFSLSSLHPPVQENSEILD